MSTDAEIRNQIIQRNSIRADAKLPLLDAREFTKLSAAKDRLRTSRSSIPLSFKEC
jgi:hypothetical protein